METKTEAAEMDGKSPRERSRRYPVFSLSSAIARSFALHEKARRSQVPAEVACRAWGLSRTSSSGMRALATMLSFGLVVTDGEGDDKRVQLSDLGFDLAKHPHKTSPEYLALLRRAALAPPVHLEIWEHYKSKGGLPPNEALAFDLERKFRLGSDAAKHLVNEIRDTFAMAKIGEESDDSPDENAHDDSADEGADDMSTATIDKPGAVTDKARVSKQREIPLPLTSGGTAHLRFPYPMREEDFEWVKLLLDKLKKGITGP